MPTPRGGAGGVTAQVCSREARHCQFEHAHDPAAKKGDTSVAGATAAPAAAVDSPSATAAPRTAAAAGGAVAVPTATAVQPARGSAVAVVAAAAARAHRGAGSARWRGQPRRALRVDFPWGKQHAAAETGA
eukprot:g11087.t1